MLTSRTHFCKSKEQKMNKLWLIIKREFLVRVKKRSFILTTLLTPLAMLLLIVAPPLISKWGDSSKDKKIAVLDELGYVMQRDSMGKVIAPISDTESIKFKAVAPPLAALQKQYKEEGFDGIVYIPNATNLDNLNVQYFSDGQLSIGDKKVIEGKIEKKLELKRIYEAGLSEEQINRFQVNIDLNQRQISIDDKGNVVEEDKKNGAEIATAMGFVMAFIIYIILLVYGSQVMRSVMEEKVNRIVEVVISSVKPFQLMLGKILGVSAVGVLQFLIWIIVIPAIAVGAQFILGMDAAELQNANQMADLGPAEQEEALHTAMEVLESLKQQNWGFIIPVFILFFLGGYFIYAAMFAAAGSAVGDDLGESQTLTLPIMVPVILSISFMGSVIENPDGSLAFWLSMIPLFSPVLMPARLPFEPPLWEVGLSLFLLILTALFFIWFAGRIYRVGILMYGKKITFKEIWKWLFY